MAGESDISADYPFGIVDGKPRTMTLAKDGTLTYEDAVVTKVGIEKSTWNVDLNEAGTRYYFNSTVILTDGMEANSRERIRVAAERNWF